jgi:hypothetical protein
MMVKVLFLDYRQIESIEGFVRKLEPPAKHSASPLLDSLHPWGANGMSFYGSVIRRPMDGLFQMWYSTGGPKGGVVCYAESKDGIEWQRPALDVVKWRNKKTNIVFDQSPHGTAVIFDERETRPGWKYKMMTGAQPSHRISAFRSGDGIHWKPAAENPVIGSNPDCPISFLRMPDGRYIAYHRAGFADRRVGRTESWNFRNFSEPCVVMEPDQCDPPNTQLYGMGTVLYGEYIIGTLWIYHTDVENMDFYKMTGYQEPEFTHSRGSYCWHRTAQGCAWIRVEEDKSRFDSGQIQPASSPVFLDDEIRYYYVGTRTRHGRSQQPWKDPSKPTAGVGMASCKPDRFVGVTAKSAGRILTRPFWTETPRFCVNANVRKGGQLRAEIIESGGNAIPGFGLADSVPASGDSTSHVLAWKGAPDMSVLANREMRVRVECRNTTLFSIFAGSPAETRRYWEFRIPTFVNMELEKART